MLRARYAVRRAELEVKRNELLSAIDAKKNVLNLEEAKRRLKQLESDIKSRQEQAQAEMAVLKEKRNKANLELNRERQRLAQVKLLSPMSGLVAIRQNRQGGFFFPGMQIPDIREGDQVQPGYGGCRCPRSVRTRSGRESRRTRSRESEGRPGREHPAGCGGRQERSTARSRA